VTERGLPLADGASACPFVAFEDDRDERASVPDHRHRCYAETRPAPRALAHQQAYCLSSAFPVCPTFQDWARREAARARDAADAAAAASGAAEAGAAAAAAGIAAAAEAGPTQRPDEPAMPAEPERPRDGTQADEFGARRNPPRDWAAPPPWLASAEAGGASDGSEAPPFLSHRVTEPGQGLAGSAADRLAGGPQPQPGNSGGTAATGAAGASAAEHARSAPGSAGSAGRGRSDPDDLRPGADADDFDDQDHEEPLRRPARRPRAYEQHLGGTDGPDWERPRRYEAYPTIKTRMALPNLPRVAVLAGAVAVAAVALFFLPAILGIGGANPAASVRPSASHAASLPPTEPPAATPLLYTIKKNETLLKIATAHGVTLEELMAANPQIKNPDKIAEGQQITIPTPSEAPPDSFGGSAEPSSGP
jgi:hypothetical protein